MNSTETRIGRKEAMSLYKEKTGREITFNGLFYLASRNNFIKQADDGFYYWFIKEKMELYLERILSPIPD